MNESDRDRRTYYIGIGFLWSIVTASAVAVSTSNGWFAAAAGLAVAGVTAIEYHYKERKTA